MLISDIPTLVMLPLLFLFARLPFPHIFSSPAALAFTPVCLLHKCRARRLRTPANSSVRRFLTSTKLNHVDLDPFAIVRSFNCSCSYSSHAFLYINLQSDRATFGAFLCDFRVPGHPTLFLAVFITAFVGRSRRFFQSCSWPLWSGDDFISATIAAWLAETFDSWFFF